MQVIPAVDVLDGRVVRLMRGDYDRVTVYGDDPVAVARRWTSEGADLVHVVDLAGARTGHPDPRLWTRLADAGVGFQVGGGIRTVEVAGQALTAGARRVVLGSAAVWEPATVGKLVAAHGNERVVAAVDVRGGRAQGAGWTDGGRPLGAVVDDLVRAGCRWVLATGIARDGTLGGPDVELVDEIRTGAPELGVIASGGVGSLAHLRTLVAAGVEAVIVGRALYEGVFSLSEALGVSCGEA